MQLLLQASVPTEEDGGDLDVSSVYPFSMLIHPALKKRLLYRFTSLCRGGER